MTYHGIDITDAMTWEDSLPRPQWDLIETWVESRVESAEQDDAWSACARQWLASLASALGSRYRVAESQNILLLSPALDVGVDAYLSFAERCRDTMSSALSDVLESYMPGKQVVLVFANRDSYYQYLSPYFSEGEHGSTAGIHIRAGYPHIVMAGTKIAQLENTLAHELTHALLSVLTLPQWVEEGLAQMFEHDITGRATLHVNEEMARQHKRYWCEHGLNQFWRGDGFSRAGDVQKLSYELAEILMRLLVEEYRPRWLGWNIEPRQRLVSFLREATAEDCGATAATDRLELRLSDIAAWFLGPGEWGVTR